LEAARRGLQGTRAIANDTPQLRTPGVIADELDAPITRVLYVLRKLGIKPIGRAGILRLYDRAAVEAVRNEMRRIEHRQGVSSASC
jgi:hypothetical protein